MVANLVRKLPHVNCRVNCALFQTTDLDPILMPWASTPLIIVTLVIQRLLSINVSDYDFAEVEVEVKTPKSPP